MAESKNERIVWTRVAWDSFDAIRARRWLIIAVTVIAAIASALREITTPSFGAESLVAVTSWTAIGELADAVPETFEPKAYERLLLSSTVIGLVGEQLVRDGHIEEGQLPPVDALRQDFWMYVDMLDQTTRPVSFSPILRLNAKASTSELAIAKVEAWTAIAIDVGNRALAGKINAATETLGAQRAEIETSLAELQDKLRAEKGSWNLEVISKDIELALARYDLLVQARQEAEQNADAARMQLAAVQELLANEDPVRVYRRSPSDDAFFIAGEDGDDLSGEVMNTEEENLVYTDLKLHEQKYRAAESEAAAKLQKLAGQLTAADEELDQLKTDLADHEIIQDRLTADIEIAQSIYTEVATASSFSVAAQSLTEGSGETGERAIGLNRVSGRVFPVAHDGVFGSRLSVMAATLTAFALIVVFVLLREVGLPLLEEIMPERSGE